MPRPASGHDSVIGTFFHRGSPWPWLTLTVVSGGVIAAILWEVWPRTADLSLLRSRPQASSPYTSPALEQVRTRLFFPQKTKAALVEEERNVPRRTALADSVRDLLRELGKGGADGAVPALPSDVEIRQMFLDTFGILYLDLDRTFPSFLAGDADRAELAVSAVVLTLTSNLSQVKRVQFLVEGQELTTRIGTADLRRPLQPRFPGEEPQPIISRPTQDAS